MISECSLRNGGQHCFLPILLNMGGTKCYSCPTCSTAIMWENNEWVEIHQEDGYWLKAGTTLTDLVAADNQSQEKPIKSAQSMTDQTRKLAHLFWQFHNDRLADPTIKEMKPYIQPILDLLERQDRVARISELEQITPGDAELTELYILERIKVLKSAQEESK